MYIPGTGVVIFAAVYLKLGRKTFAMDGAVRSDIFKKTRHPCHSLSCIPGKGLWPDTGYFGLEILDQLISYSEEGRIKNIGKRGK